MQSKDMALLQRQPWMVILFILSLGVKASPLKLRPLMQTNVIRRKTKHAAVLEK